MFTGIAVSVLIGPDKESANLIQGTIAAAAVINEIIAVIFAKKGFEWAGELDNQNVLELDKGKEKEKEGMIITISRQYGSGGHEIGKELAKQLEIPFYDYHIIRLAAKSSSLDKNLFANYEQSGIGTIRHDLAMEVNNDYSLDDQVFRHQSDVIRELAKKGPCIIVGRCADYILKDNKNVLKVFIHANKDSRRDRIEKVYKKDSKRLEKMDKQRTAYYNFYTNQKFGDAENYDLCLDSGYFGIENCADIISSVYSAEKEELHKIK